MLGGTCCLDPRPPQAQAQTAPVLTGTDREEESPDWTEKPRAPTQDLGVRKSVPDRTGQAGLWKEVGSGPRELHPRAPVGALPPPREPHHVCRRADTGYAWATGGATLPVTPPAAKGRSGQRVSADPPQGRLLGSGPHPRPAGGLCPQRGRPQDLPHHCARPHCTVRA